MSSDNGKGETESLGGVQISTPDSVSIEIVTEKRLWHRRIQRVPLKLRLMKSHNHSEQYMYDPMTVSLGPYHHGKTHLLQMEEFKQETLALFLSGSDREKGFYNTKILDQIDEIRSCYVGVTVDDYDDRALSEMMLVDASFLIYFMKTRLGDVEIIRHGRKHIGVLGVQLMHPECHMLENQIPYWILEFLLSLRFGEAEAKALIFSYLTALNPGDRITRLPWGEKKEDKPLHLIEASQRILSLQIFVTTEIVRPTYWIFKWMYTKKKSKKDSGPYEFLGREFYSATYLREKGIHFVPTSKFTRDVRFISHPLYGELQLPIRYVSIYGQVIFQNMIAFEMSPGADAGFATTSFVNFYKALVENSKDVKELREKGILISRVGSDDECVKVIHEIDTLGIDEDDLLYNVKVSITEHCSHKGKTWLAELVNANFRSPWTVTALLAATFLLVLTILQTYFTIRGCSS